MVRLKANLPAGCGNRKKHAAWEAKPQPNTDDALDAFNDALGTQR